MTGLLLTYPHVYQILAILSFGCILLFGRFKLNLRRRNPNGLPLPPGPKGLPLIGNLFDFPTNHQWLVYDEWQKTYGKYFLIDWLLQWITGHFRRYDVLQCPWPALFDFELSATDDRPVREKIFKLLRQNATTHVGWTVCIIFLRFSTFQTCFVIPEWSGISPSLFFHMVQHGRNTGVHFKSFFTTMRC